MRIDTVTGKAVEEPLCAGRAVAKALNRYAYRYGHKGKAVKEPLCAYRAVAKPLCAQVRSKTNERFQVKTAILTTASNCFVKLKVTCALPAVLGNSPA